MKTYAESEAERTLGPQYPELKGEVTKWRRLARKGLAKLEPIERQAYGEAVEIAIRNLQRSELFRGVAADPRPRGCASGSWATTGDEIHKAIRRQHAADLRAWPAKVRRERTPEQWREMYAEAMQQQGATA